MLTRKHFQALADALKSTRPERFHGGSEVAQWESDVRAVANVCSRSNSGFDPDRFFVACGYPWAKPGEGQ